MRVQYEGTPFVFVSYDEKIGASIVGAVGPRFVLRITLNHRAEVFPRRARVGTPSSWRARGLSAPTPRTPPPLLSRRQPPDATPPRDSTRAEETVPTVPSPGRPRRYPYVCRHRSTRGRCVPRARRRGPIRRRGVGGFPGGHSTRSRYPARGRCDARRSPTRRRTDPSSRRSPRHRPRHRPRHLRPLGGRALRDAEEPFVPQLLFRTSASIIASVYANSSAQRPNARTHHMRCDHACMFLASAASASAVYWRFRAAVAAPTRAETRRMWFHTW